MAIDSDTVTDSELLRMIAEDLAFLLAVVEPLVPLAEAISGPSGQANAVRAAGLRKALRKARRDAT